jgi:ABC-type cobalt transport system substrate-binding protein
MTFRPWHLGLIVAAAVIVMVALVTGGDQPGSTGRAGDAVTKTISQIEPNATASFAIRLVEGNDAEHESIHIFEALEHPSVAKLSLDTVTLWLTVDFDASTLSETAIRQQLIKYGYLEISPADATPAEVSADGAGQAIHLVPGDELTPYFIRAKAGIPLTITFSAGSGHLASVSIPALGITQDITTEGASIVIDDPAVGEYELMCAEGYADAVLFVE